MEGGILPSSGVRRLTASEARRALTEAPWCRPTARVRPQRLLFYDFIATTIVFNESLKYLEYNSPSMDERRVGRPRETDLFEGVADE